MDKDANRITLQNIARKAMLARGLEPDFTAEELKELFSIGHIEANTIVRYEVRSVLKADSNRRRWSLGTVLDRVGNQVSPHLPNQYGVTTTGREVSNMEIRPARLTR